MLKLLKMLKTRDLMLLFVAIGFIVLSVWLDMKVPMQIKYIQGLVDSGVGNPGTYVARGVIMFSFVIASMIASFVVAFLASLISASHSEKIRYEIYKKVDSFSLKEVKKFSTPSLITRSTNDVTHVRTFISAAIQMIIRAPVVSIWAIVEMGRTDWRLGMSPLGAVLIVVIVALLIMVICLPRIKKVQTQTDELTKNARENLTGVRVVRAFNAKEFEEKKFDKTNKALAKNNAYVNKFLGIVYPLLQLLLSCSAVLIYWIGAAIIDAGPPDPSFIPSIIVFVQFSNMIIYAFFTLVMAFSMLPQTLVSAKRIEEVLNEKGSIVDKEKVVVIEEKINKIEFDSVNFVYPGAEKNVLSDINFIVEQGQTVAFIGSTGSGKSTLVNLLSRIYDVTNGSIKLNGINIKDISIKQLNNIIGYVPQTARIFEGTIKENVLFGESAKKDPTDEDVKRALEIAQAWEFVNRLEEGINHKIEQKGKNLSGGQKQRLSIARTVVREPDVFIFDDTFSAVDYKTDKKLRESIKKTTKEAIVFIVAQRIGTIKEADQIFVLDNGRIVNRGKHDDLLKNCKVYKEIALSQLNEEELKIS